MRPRLPALVLLALLAAGCTGDPTPEEAVAAAGVPDDEAPRIETAAPLPPPAEDGPTLAAGSGDAAEPSAPEGAPASVPSLFAAGGVPRIAMGGSAALRGACRGACPPASFVAEAGSAALLEVRVTWNGTRTRGFTLEVVAPNGTVHAGTRGFDAARVILPDAAPGAYVARVAGEGDVAGGVSLRARWAARGEGADRLPDLVTLVPTEVGVADCDPWEQAEQKAARCLRLGNAIGNVGDGPLKVALSTDQGLSTPLGGGRFVQHVFQEQGAPRVVPVGAAAFHPTHAHFHYDGLARFSLHAVDPATGLRGEAVTTHHKAGFCLVDVGRMEEPDVEAQRDPGSILDMPCLIPTLEGWSMGVSRGYYDLYGAGLTDQYVEISGVGDGTYELVSAANWAGSLLELDPANNEASVLVLLLDGKVTVLEERGFYRVPG